MKKPILTIILLLPLLLFSQSYIVNEYQPKTDSLLIYFDTDTSSENNFRKIPTCQIECNETIINSSIDAMLPSTTAPCSQREKIIARSCLNKDKEIYNFNQYSGKLEGYYIINHPSGKSWIRYIYKKDKITEIVEHFYDANSSKPKIEDTPQKLLALVELDEDGKLKNIKAQYDLKGKKLKKGSFKNGSGTILFYRGTGSLLRSVQMKNGRPHGKCIYYYPSGEVLVSGQFNLGLFTGEWKEYAVSGEVLTSTTFKSIIENN